MDSAKSDIVKRVAAEQGLPVTDIPLSRPKWPLPFSDDPPPPPPPPLPLIEQMRRLVADPVRSWNDATAHALGLALSEDPWDRDLGLLTLWALIRARPAAPGVRLPKGMERLRPHLEAVGALERKTPAELHP